MIVNCERKKYAYVLLRGRDQFFMSSHEIKKIKTPVTTKVIN